MKVQITSVAAALFMVCATLAQAQTQTSGTQQKPEQHQPGQLQAKTPAAEQPTGAQSAAPEGVDPAKDVAIRHLLDITDTSRMGDHISGAISMQVRSAMRRSMPEDRLQKFMVDFDQRFRTRVPSDQVVDLVVPIYAQHFSIEDLRGLIQFYESPLGQRVVKTLPEVAQESQNAGMKLEGDAAMATLRGMTGDYPELKLMLEDQLQPSPAPTQAPGPTPKPNPPQN
jgi:hypothetical protein